jgi:NTE family protein
MKCRVLLSVLLGCFLLACSMTPGKTLSPPQASGVRIGLALGGGAAKGYAHIGVIKMLESQGLAPDVVSGTSAGSIVGSLYCSGMNAFTLQEKAFDLDESKIRDFSLLSGGLLKGLRLQNYVNSLVGQRPLEKLGKPFAAVATELGTGQRIHFVRGNTGLAVRASCSIPGVFEPAEILGKKYVDGGVVSPVPVDAARELGGTLVIAVDISRKAKDSSAGRGPLGVVGQSIVIMGQKLGEQELARADVIIRPKVGQIGATDFDQKNLAIMEGEKAALAAIPEIRKKLAEKEKMLQGTK